GAATDPRGRLRRVPRKAHRAPGAGGHRVPDGGPPEPAAGLTARRFTRGPVARAITTTGAVDPVITVEVGAYVSGTIQACYCDYNTQVKAGQLCAKIRPATLPGRRGPGRGEPGERPGAAEEGPGQPDVRQDQLRPRPEPPRPRHRVSRHRRQRQEHVRSGRGAGEGRRVDDPAAAGGAAR